jgi:hypothetical protein
VRVTCSAAIKPWELPLLRNSKQLAAQKTAPSLLRRGRRYSIRRAIPHGFKTSFEQRCQCRIRFVMHIIVLA